MATAGASIPAAAQHMHPPASCLIATPSVTDVGGASSESAEESARDATSRRAPSMPRAPNSFTRTAHFSPTRFNVGGGE
jgi:hypothetical protein